MPINKYDKAVKLLKDYTNVHKIFKPKKISMTTLRRIIIKEIGSDEYRTIKPYIKLMIETKLIKDIGNEKFKVLWELEKK